MVAPSRDELIARGAKVYSAEDLEKKGIDIVWLHYELHYRKLYPHAVKVLSREGIEVHENDEIFHTADGNRVKELFIIKH